MFFIKVNQFCRLHYFELMHAAKSAFALLLGYALVRLVNHPELHQQWLLVTIAVVMGTHTTLGMQMQRAYLRFIATLCGGALACITLLSPSQAIAIPIFLAITGFIFMFTAVTYDKYSHFGILGVVTYCIIVLSIKPSLTIALDRTLETLCGILIAVSVSLFVFPIHIEKVFKRHLYKNFFRLQQIYASIFLEKKVRSETPEVLDIERQIIKTNQAVLSLSNMPKYGLRKKAKPDPIIQKIIQYERAMYRYWVVIEVTHRILNERKSSVLYEHEALFQKFIEDVIAFLRVVSDGDQAQVVEVLEAMRKNQLMLHESIDKSKANLEEMSALQTMCFITFRLCVVTKRLAYFMRKNNKD